jgi:predicted component of type VI protein secretion system
VPSLRVISGPREGEQIDFDRTVVVGRHEADVVIDDPELSRRHLQIQVVEDGLIIEDLGSTNGTFVDERPIDAPTHLGQGDRFTLGTTIIEVEFVADPGATRLRQTPAGPDGTRMRSIPPAAVEPVAGRPVDSELVAVSSPPAAAAPIASHAAPPLAAHASASGGAQPLQPMGAFRPPSVRRGVGLASRSWIPVALSFGTVILTAIALVIYFAQR